MKIVAIGGSGLIGKKVVMNLRQHGDEVVAASPSSGVNTVGPIRQVVQGEDNMPRRYLVIVPGTAQQHGTPVQVQAK